MNDTSPDSLKPSATASPETCKRWLAQALGLPAGASAFPWQEELLRRFASGSIERSIDIPTGLGKTAVMALWLLARAQGAALPRRLVYVVDRRAVVDQATEVARGLRALVRDDRELRAALGLGERPLPISTLRGQYVDNKEWLEDPASVAIVVGTVDMVGSRLLFEGYGTTRKMRPYLAGLLGADTLIVLDEAHLVPPFEKLIEAITESGEPFRPQERSLEALVPRLRLLSLSATGRSNSHQSFGLQEKDIEHPVVNRRLVAPKRLSALPALEPDVRLADALAEQAWALSGGGTTAVRCIVFCNSRDDAAAAKDAVERTAKGDKKAGIPPTIVNTELFVGGRRVFEREEASKRLVDLGFIAGTAVARSAPAFLFATSAGEVGVDLDADHMVSDLVAWERMVQRFGRVNRRGDGAAEIIVLVQAEPKPKKNVQLALEKAESDRSKKETEAIAAHVERIKKMRAYKKALDLLPEKNDAQDASPGAIRELKTRAVCDPQLQAILDAATTPPPLRPALSRALVDAWSLTSLKEHTGRPEVQPWLRGWITEEPQTTVVWRTYLPVRNHEDPTKRDVETYFEAAPPHASEMLETETYRVVDWLVARADELAVARLTADDPDQVDGRARLRLGDTAAIVLGSAGEFSVSWQLGEIHVDANTDEKKRKEALKQGLVGRTLIVDARLGGLESGLLHDGADTAVRTVDDGQPWLALEAPSPASPPAVRFRVRKGMPNEPPSPDPYWRERLRFIVDRSDEGDATQWLVVEKWRHDSATEEDRSAGRPQLLAEHQSWTKACADSLARKLGLPDPYVEMLAIAAGLHDEGKRARRWQRAMNAASDGPYAKTSGPVNVALLDGYRHEFGSLPYAAKDPQLGQLPGDLQDLALHLIAAHHGFARPVIATDGCQDAPSSLLGQRAKDVALRFARLQKRWGPWGLAWWEALLRAADQQASRANDEAALPGSGVDL